MVFCVWLILLSMMFSLFICAVAWVCSSFLLIVKYYSTVWIWHPFISLFIHPFISWQTFELFPLFWLLWITWLWPFTYKFSCWHMFLINIFQPKLHLSICSREYNPWHLPNSPLGIYPPDRLVKYKMACTAWFITPLFVLAKCWKQ